MHNFSIPLLNITFLSIQSKFINLKESKFCFRQGSVSGHGFPPLRDPGNSSDPGFLQDRETSRTSSETGFLQTRPRPDVLDKVKGEKVKYFTMCLWLHFFLMRFICN